MKNPAIWDVYTKFKIHFYMGVFSNIQNREASLTTVEAYCVEIIHAMGRPTVNEFATLLNISPPNATYKISSLMHKGYLKKIQNPSDRREYYLQVTQKYMDYYALGSSYLKTVMDRVHERFSPEDCDKLEQMLQVIGMELMPEVQIK